MGTVKKKDVMGYIFCDGKLMEIVCLNCITPDDLEDLTREEVLTREFLENTDYLYFCDRCENEI